ncbi:MAG: class I SAM-dependent methyltransferase [Rhodobacteraceae bacterium]|nr:class I SAM-dependent methyltransferase [Paracoccaceae bacterium]
MELKPADFERFRDAFLQTDLPAFARYLSDLQFHRNPRTDAPQALAEELGLVRPGTRELTETGWFVADSCREYVFWLERDRRLPNEAEGPSLFDEALAGRSVLEIGSGSGMNLLSLAGRAAEVVGLEPVAIYRQIGAIMAEAEGIGPLQVVPGAAENLPFENARFDTVFCFSAHQYFEIFPAMAEIARVLRPGGQAFLISGTLQSYARGCAGALIGRQGIPGAKAYIVTLVNTLGYMMFGRRIIVRPSKWTTAYPVYPGPAWMRRTIARAGLQPAPETPRIGTETCFRAFKPGG